ncbi:MAG: type III pantothenate kinase [Muribaculaceae bacterium]|nr:type III pantothenate kinase [Muribaculaceae bacterium]
MSKHLLTGNLLTLDRGNSALKADVWKDDTIVETVVMPPACIRRQLKALTNRHELVGAMYCSVTDNGDYVREILDEADVPLHILTHETPVPLEIEYGSKGTLGVDRIAGCLGAISLFPNRELLVVDLGTAITYDRVTASGRFLGGNIAPGVSLRLKALNAFTARLPKVELDGDVPEWGYDTPTALRAGAIKGIVGEVSYYRSLLPRGAKVVLTGGSAPRIAPHLKFSYVMEPHLVTIGLKTCLDSIVENLTTVIVQ